MVPCKLWWIRLVLRNTWYDFDLLARSKTAVSFPLVYPFFWPDRQWLVCPGTLELLKAYPTAVYREYLSLALLSLRLHSSPISLDSSMPARVHFPFLAIDLGNSPEWRPFGLPSDLCKPFLLVWSSVSCHDALVFLVLAWFVFFVPIKWFQLLILHNLYFYFSIIAFGQARFLILESMNQYYTLFILNSFFCGSNFCNMSFNVASSICATWPLCIAWATTTSTCIALSGCAALKLP